MSSKTKTRWLLIVAAFFQQNYFMPDIKFSEFDQVTVLNGTESLVGYADTDNIRVLVSDLKKFIKPYKEYVATLAQTGTADPVATILKNELTGTIMWERGSTGQFTGTVSDNQFVANKTFITVNSVYPDRQHQAYRINEDSVEIDQQDMLGVSQDVLYGNLVEIRVYY